MKEKTYLQGMEDAIETWGKLCGCKAICDECPIGIIKGTEIDCTEFAKQFPQKFVSLMLEWANNNNITYAEEFHTRFPASPISAEELVELGYCRRTIFEGHLTCQKPSSECVKCWNTPFVTDVDENAVAEDEAMAQEAKFCGSCGERLQDDDAFCCNCGAKIER